MLMGVSQPTSHYMGTGSGSFNLTSMAGINPGDTVFIAAGTYTGGSFGNIHDITIMNYGGVVTFTGQLQWGNNSQYLYNVTLSGSGSPFYKYGFRFQGINTYAFNFGLSSSAATGFYGNRFYYLDFENVSGEAFKIGYYRPVYNGTWQKLALYKSSFAYLKLNKTYALIDMPSHMSGDLWICDSVDIHDNIINQSTTNGYQINGSCMRFNIYNNICTYSGYNSQTGDVGFAVVQGNGQFHNNKIYGGRGYFMRLIAMSFASDSVISDSYIYSNIKLGTSCYGGVDVRGSLADFGSSNTKLTYGNTHIMNNTIGNLTADDNYSTDIAICYPNLGKVYVYNNLAFNTYAAGNDDHTIDDFSSGNGGTAPIRGANVYYPANIILNHLVDTIICMPKKGDTLLNSGIPNVGAATDFYGHNITTNLVGAVADTSSIIVTPPPPTYLPPVVTEISNSSIAQINIYANDPNGGAITSYQWSKVSGIGMQSILNPNSPSPIIVGLQSGSYVFQCVVTNSEGKSTIYTSTINVIIN